MPITTAEIEAELEKVQRAILTYGTAGRIRRASHSGSATSRDVEYFAGVSLAELRRMEKRLLRQLGRTAEINQCGPMYP